MKEQKNKACKCDDWLVNMNKIDTIFQMAWVHGYKYYGKQFVYCPFCGEKLK
jgi:hypothetical protein